MIATIYSLPSWISNIDNKPSLQAFNLMLSNSNTLTIDKAELLQQPTLTNLVIRSSCTIPEWYKYNYVKFQGLWYVIKDFQYMDDNNHSVDINCELDIYLSQMVVELMEIYDHVYEHYYQEQTLIMVNSHMEVKN